MNYSIIWKEIAERFYTQPILVILQFIAILIALKYCRNDKIAKFFVFLFAFDLTVQLINFSHSGNEKISKNTIVRFTSITNTLITIIELNIYYYYYKLILTSKKLKTFFTLIPIFYTILALSHSTFIFEFSTLRKNQISFIIYSLEFALILPAVIIFFIKLIKTTTDTSLFSRPSFWISVGIFFQCTISIPCYLLISYLLKQKTEYMPIIEATLYYTPFIINTLFIIKAFLCKKTLTI